MFRTPKRAKAVIDENEIVEVTPPNKYVKLIPLDSNEKSPANGSPCTTLSPNETRRGRPRAEVLNTLILQGSTSPSSIKCTFCNRVFPREKSLQAHLRTHTGEKPYVCDYPRCTRKFAQSGQLKTHQRLHTGEKPFICAFPHCQRRFTHANRHCPEHPDMTLKRYNVSHPTSIEKINDEEHSNAVQKWLDSIKRREKRPNGINSTPKKSKFGSKGFKSEQNENDYLPLHSKQSLVKHFEQTKANELFKNSLPTSSKSMSSSASLEEQISQEYASAEAMIELHNGSYQSMTPQQLFRDVNGGTSKECNEIPKKRWLREAVLDQQRWDSNQVLARPINWGDDPHIVECENQKRPTVLVRVDQAEKKEISKTDLQLAMALVELRNSKYYNF